MHEQRFKIGSLVTSWKARQIIFNDFNSMFGFIFEQY